MASERSVPLATDPEAVRTLAVLSRLVERALDGMTLPQYRVLLVAARAPERANRLARQAAVSRPSLTGVLDGLESRGWIRRCEVDGDRRGITLEVTAAGGRALAVATGRVQARLDEVLGLLDDRRRAAAMTGLAALGEAVETELARRRAARDAGS